MVGKRRRREEVGSGRGVGVGRRPNKGHLEGEVGSGMETWTAGARHNGPEGNG